MQLFTTIMVTHIVSSISIRSAKHDTDVNVWRDGDIDGHGDDDCKAESDDERSVDV